MITRDPLPSNEELLALAAVKQVAKFALTKPTTYDLFLMILTQWLTLGQDCKAVYLKEVAGIFQDADGDPAEWRKWKAKLEVLMIKGQDVALRGGMLLQDWQLNQATAQQLQLFTATKEPRDE